NSGPRIVVKAIDRKRSLQHLLSPYAIIADVLQRILAWREKVLDVHLTRVCGRVSKAATYSPVTISSNALIPVKNVTVCNKPPASEPSRFAPSAASLRSAAANERMNTTPLKSIGRLVSAPTNSALVG